MTEEVARLNRQTHRDRTIREINSILREALERIADGDSLSDVYCMVEIARDALLRARKGEEPQEAIPQPERRISCGTCAHMQGMICTHINGYCVKGGFRPGWVDVRERNLDERHEPAPKPEVRSCVTCRWDDYGECVAPPSDDICGIDAEPSHWTPAASGEGEEPTLVEQFHDFNTFFTKPAPKPKVRSCNTCTCADERGICDDPKKVGHCAWFARWTPAASGEGKA